MIKMTKNEDSHKVKLNKISLFLNILLTIFAAISITSTPIFNYFFQGELSETLNFPTYKEKFKGENYYVYIFKYKQTGGNPIESTTIRYDIENSGSEIDYFIPFYKSLYRKNNINAVQSKKNVVLDIGLIRPNDEFDFWIYTKNRAKLNSRIIMKNGRLSNSRTGQMVRNPAIWIISLLILYFIFTQISCRKTVKILEEEKQRIIVERNNLQNLYLKGNRLTTGKRRQ